MTTLALFQGLGHTELIIILVLGLLIFGSRLPQVGRSLGKSIVEFKRGIKGIQDEIDTESSEPAQLDKGKAGLSAGDERRVSRSDTMEEAAPGSVRPEGNG